MKRASREKIARPLVDGLFKPFFPLQELNKSHGTKAKAILSNRYPA
ncbi:Hypothetical protein Minf_2081 [Methylacidiphilum infernorum V4]|uniref:Uncharacterized protein n=1 Tax=Methylacidiphilum infernorum (isolate V4) TaxID=481448 RepID=B3DZ43_METI4|nr:Hypothetical protein Minf_2081 [Methylacidiphilum infernorum V4]